MSEFATKEQLQSLAVQVSNLVIQNLVSEQVISALLATHPNPAVVLAILQETTPHIEHHLLFSANVSDNQIALFREKLQVRITELQHTGKN